MDLDSIRAWNYVIEHSQAVRNDTLDKTSESAQVPEVFHALFELFLYSLGLCCCRSGVAAMQTHSGFVESAPCSDS